MRRGEEGRSSVAADHTCNWTEFSTALLAPTENIRRDHNSLVDEAYMFVRHEYLPRLQSFL